MLLPNKGWILQFKFVQFGLIDICVMEMNIPSASLTIDNVAI